MTVVTHHCPGRRHILTGTYNDARRAAMNVYFAELLGTAILILLGNGVVANVVLARTKGHGAGWMVICAGWGLAVYTAVLCVGETSGAHINPAVTLGVALAGQFAWAQVPGYIAAQLVGAFVGAVLVYLFYLKHYDATADADSKLATFSTSPSIRHVGLNLLCEVVATFVLVYAVLLISDPSFAWAATGSDASVPIGLGSIGAVRVGLIDLPPTVVPLVMRELDSFLCS